MSARLPVFHIGSNKAGSTTLQKALFSRHAGVLNLGKPAPNHEAARAVAAILKANDHRGNTRPVDDGVVQRIWANAVAAAAKEDRVPVFSREELIRNYFYGAPDPQRVPKALKAMAGQLRVVIVIRHQFKLIESLYVHKANSVNYLPPDKWFGLQPESLAFGYKFHEIADAWANVIGVKNVGVFLFEELASDSDSFARRLCGFIGIDPDEGARLLSDHHENVRKSARTQRYARLRSMIFPKVSLGRVLPAPVRRKWRGYLENGAPASVDLPADWLERMDELYRSDNRKLAERFGLPLKDYGYPL